MLHGYNLPKPEAVGGRPVLLTGNRDVYAIDTWTARTDHGVPAELILVSVPVFCGCLVERIAAEAPDDWDDALIDTDYRLPPDLTFRLKGDPGAFSADAGDAPFSLAFPPDPAGAALDDEEA